MCFSAQASFAAAAFLSSIGILSIIKSRTKSMRFLASSILLFGLQQSLEGIVWLTLTNSTTSALVQQYASFGFIFFALIFWPISVPCLLYKFERHLNRKKVLQLFLGLGIVSAICSIAGIYLYGIHPQIINHHISYSLLTPENLGSYSIMYMINSLFYVLAVVGSLCASSISYMWLLGVIVALGLAVSIALYWLTFGSVWCFFGAVASLLIYFIIQQEQKR